MDNQPPAAFSKSVAINATPQAVWAALTTPGLMKQWMSESVVDVTTDWTVGGSIDICGQVYKKPFDNYGTVLAFDPGHTLRYSHLSSLSHLPNAPESYCVLDFTLTPNDGHTVLILTITNFPTETIYKHLAFYWNVTLEILKKFVEGN